MRIHTAIAELRKQVGLSQAELADELGVSRQTVQKWESRTAIPDISHIVAISRLFGVSIDTMMFENHIRITEAIATEKIVEPQYSRLPVWELYSDDLMVELRQCAEEGKKIQSYANLFSAVSNMPPGQRKEKMADILYEIAVTSPQRQGYPYIEPSDLLSIQKQCCQASEIAVRSVDMKTIRQKIYGAWMGRICGCLLGKPVEGIRTDELLRLLKQSKNYPMRRYIRHSDITDEMLTSFHFLLKDKCYADTISCAPVDDDTNYTVLAMQIIEKYGRSFTPYDVSRMWVHAQPKDAYCTAERVAYINFLAGYVPPDSAVYKNPYREWIGAQIRGDYFGYINPGNPKLAAEMAWRDASISHVKNGIYGEMFVAAMLAWAAVSQDMEEVIEKGLEQIPARSRLYESVCKVRKVYSEGMDEKHCFAWIHQLYDEKDSHDWCHTIPNAMIVTASLLYGKGRFGKSICRAVQTGFDTDCNGATVGSILGMMYGIDAIDKEWTDPICGELDTSIFGVGKVKISDLVDMTMKHMEKR